LPEVPKAERARLKRLHQKYERGRKALEKKARAEETVRWEAAKIGREKLYVKGGRRAERQMKAELAALREGLEITAERFPPPVPVQGYLYQDGRAIARLILPIPKRGSVREFLLDVWERGWWQFSAGTMFEASFLYDPKKDPYNGQKKDYLSKYNGKLQVQTFGTASPANLFATLRGITETGWSLLKKLQEVGYARPDAVMFRVGRSYDGSRVFRKKKPPVK
jgi:hypothetical protein